MADFFEFDFLEVHKSKSGDAIAARYSLNGVTYIHVIDGGYLATGDDLVNHINTFYNNPYFIDHVLVTHPDRDHAEGIQRILETYVIGTLWMLLPWNYIDELIGRFDRYSNADNLKKKLKEAYPYLAELERIANEKGITIREPFQGQKIGSFTVLAPSRPRYLDLVVTSTKTPKAARAAAAEDGWLVKAGGFLVDSQLGKAFIRVFSPERY